MGRALCLLLIGVLIAPAPAAAQGAGSEAAYYIDAYGLVDSASTPFAVRAQGVFDRVKRVVDLSGRRVPRLLVIDSDSKPWAVALPDGYIVLSRGVLNISYQGVDAAEGDARLAFVLGHELAHLAADDFWHRDVFLSLAGEAGQIEVIRNLAGNQGSEQWLEQIREKELRADDNGFLYASLAGFATSALVAEQPGNAHFFDEWVAQTRSGDDALHPDPDQRHRFLLARFQSLIGYANLYDYGVKLAHFGRWPEALKFFEEVQRVFPSREVLNNLGFVHLQRARTLMSPERAYYYWLPDMLDTGNPLAGLTRSLAGEDVDAIRAELARAAEYLGQAVRMDASHVPSRINLAIVHLYDGQVHKARALVEEVRQLTPGDPRIESLRALILVEQEKDIDMWPIAVEQHEKLLSRSDDPALLYNLARLMEERGRTDQAQRYWRALNERREVLPGVYARLACEKLGAAPCPGGAGGISLAAALDLGDVPLGLDTRAGALPAGWVLEQGGDLRGTYVESYADAQGNRFLALDGQVALAVIDYPPVPVSTLHSCCGQPLHRQALIAGGEVWDYGASSAAVVRNAALEEVWISR